MFRPVSGAPAARDMLSGSAIGMPVTLVRYWGSYFKSLRHSRRVAAYFARCSEAGWRCVLVACRPPEDPAWNEPIEALGVEIVYLPRIRRNFDPGGVARTFRLCRSFGADVFHCDNTHTSPLIGAAAAGVPVRLWSKRSMEPAFEAGREPGLKERIAISLRVSCALATRTLPVSELVADELVRKGIPRSRIQVLLSAVEPGENVPTPRDRARAALGVAPDVILIAAVGRADPVKGWDLLLRSFASASGRVPGLQLLLVGSVGAPQEAAFKAQLDRLIAELGIGAAVRFTGHLPTIADVLGAADVFALPSRSEGHSLALVEALRAGLPCVASNVGGAPELIRQGENGMLFARGDERALADALVALAADASLRSRIAAAARWGLRMPTPAEHSKALFDLYTELLSRHAPRRLPRQGAHPAPRQS